MKPNKKGGKKNLPFGRRMLIFLAGVLAFVGLLAMIFCMMCPLVSPDKFVWLSFFCLLYTSPSPRDSEASRMPSSA